MPMMSASARRPRAAASSALQRIQKSAITKAAPKPKESKKQKKEKEKEVCTICMDDLSGTRETKIACGHRFHRTCIINWLEKQLRSSDQACPNCRAPYGFIMNGRKRDTMIGAYGDHQQPSLWYVHRLARERQEKEPRSPYKTCLELTQRRQLANTMESLRQLRAERAQYIASKSDTREFIRDIDHEITKLDIRKKINKEMAILAGAIGAGLLPERSPDVGWNLEEELREVRGLPKRVREPTPIDSSEDEVVEEEEEESDEEENNATRYPRGGIMRMHAPSSRSRRFVIIIDDDDDDDVDVQESGPSVAMSTGGRAPRHLLETAEARSSSPSPQEILPFVS